MIRIYHVGAWGRNHGDRAIQVAMQDALTRLAAQELGEVAHIYPIDIQAGPFTEHVAEVRDNADLLIVGGGGLLWDKPELASRSGWQWDVTLEEFEALDGVPTWLYALGWTRFPYGDQTGDDGRLFDSLRGLTAAGAELSVRNTQTMMRLRAELIDAARVADPALFSTGLPMDRRWPRGDGPTIGLVWASDKSDWRWPETETEAQMVDTLLSVAEAAKAQLVLIEHIADLDCDWLSTVRETWQVQIHSIQELYPELYPATRATVRRLVGLYEHMDAVWSMRKHGLLLAMSQGVRAIGLGQLPEVKWFCDDYGLPCAQTAGSFDALAGVAVAARVEGAHAYRHAQVAGERMWSDAYVVRMLQSARRRVTI